MIDSLILGVLSLRADIVTPDLLSFLGALVEPVEIVPSQNKWHGDDQHVRNAEQIEENESSPDQNVDDLDRPEDVFVDCVVEFFVAFALKEKDLFVLFVDFSAPFEAD